MLKKLPYFLPTIILLSVYFIQSNLPETQRRLVTKVLDGDTLELENGDRIRLLGINAPELGEAFSEEAKLALEEMVLGKVVKIEKDAAWNKDKYGRLLRYVFLEGKLVNCEMVRLGLAESIAEKEVKYYNCFKEAEQEAKEKKLGIWSSS
ncbi:MAG: thermonuclease family protein [Candidatus Aenigmatarchaeota archaeon]